MDDIKKIEELAKKIVAQAKPPKAAKNQKPKQTQKRPRKSKKTRKLRTSEEFKTKRINIKPQREKEDRRYAKLSLEELKENYKGIWRWNNHFGRGVLTAMLRGGFFDDIIGFEFGKKFDKNDYVPPEEYKKIYEVLKQSSKFYHRIHKLLGVWNYSFDDLSNILEQDIYEEDLYYLFYKDPMTSAVFDFEGHFIPHLKALIKKVRDNTEYLQEMEK